MRVIDVTKDEKGILVALLEVSQTGMTIGDVRQAIKVIDKLEQDANTVKLEDAEYQYLLGRFNATKFSMAKREVVALADKLESAPEVRADAVAKG